MSEAIAYPHITRNGDVAAYLKRLPRVRVVDVVLPHLAHGWSADELHRQFPHLTLGEIHACLGYYFDNPAEIEKLINDDLELAGRLRGRIAGTDLGLRLREVSRLE